MALKDRKINDWSQSVSSLEDKPQMNASDLKAVFDSNTNQLKPAVNGIIDDLTGTEGAGNIGLNTIDGVDGENVQQCLESLYDIVMQIDTGDPNPVQYIKKTDIGTAGGVAPLDDSAKITTEYLPDDLLSSQDKASQEQALAGEDDTKYMTPLKTKNAIDGDANKGLIKYGGELKNFDSFMTIQAGSKYMNGFKGMTPDKKFIVCFNDSDNDDVYTLFIVDSETFETVYSENYDSSYDYHFVLGNNIILVIPYDTYNGSVRIYNLKSGKWSKTGTSVLYSSRYVIYENYLTKFQKYGEYNDRLYFCIATSNSSDTSSSSATVYIDIYSIGLNTTSIRHESNISNINVKNYKYSSYVLLDNFIYCLGSDGTNQYIYKYELETKLKTGIHSHTYSYVRMCTDGTYLFLEKKNINYSPYTYELKKITLSGSTQWTKTTQNADYKGECLNDTYCKTNENGKLFDIKTGNDITSGNQFQIYFDWYVNSSYGINPGEYDDSDSKRTEGKYIFSRNFDTIIEYHPVYLGGASCL